MSLPFISVIVPVYNGQRFVKQCLEALLAQDYPKERHEILIVDNGSTDGSAEEIRRHPVTYVLKPKPRGPAAARNAGIEQACGEIIAFTDIDCVPDRGWLIHLVEGWDDPRYGGCAGRIDSVPTNNSIQQWMAQFFDQGVNLQSLPFAFAQTANVAYRRRLFDQIGGFDEGLRWWQDAELSWRMQEHTDYQYKWNPNAVVYHRGQEDLRGVARKFFGRGYGRAAVAKRVRSLRKPPIGWVSARHGLRACTQLGKMALRGLPAPLVRSQRKALLRHEFWFTFHTGMAVGMAVGACDFRNRRASVPSMNGNT